MCNYAKVERIGKPGNLLKHLVTHEIGKKWANLFEAHKNTNKNHTVNKLDKNTIHLAKFFIALKTLESKDLPQLLPFKMSRYSFKKVILPSLMNVLKTKINDKLRSCEYVNLIPDIWTNYSTVDYLALGANLIYENFKRDTLIIGMIEMVGRHTAENIKAAIERIINEYNFNKSKVNSVACDEGSNFVRLFKQPRTQTTMYIEIDALDDDEDFNPNEGEAEEECDEDDGNSSDDDLETEFLKEIEKDVNFLNSNLKSVIKFNSKSSSDLIEQASESAQNNDIEDNIDADDHLYDLTKGDIIKTLDLKIGDNVIVRVCCANHKLNLALKRSINQCEHFNNLLSTLSTHASKNKHIIEIQKLHRANRSKIHRQNFTRWNSSFEMLLTYLKSFQKGIYNGDYACPIEREQIEHYIQICLPLYLFTNDLQSCKANISCVLPGILALLNENLSRMVLLDENENQFRQALIKNIKFKFAFELNSSIYIAAALFNVKKVLRTS